MGGTLVFGGAECPLRLLLDYLDDGYSFDEFLGMLPSVKREEVVEFLRLARGEADAGRP